MDEVLGAADLIEIAAESARRKDIVIADLSSIEGAICRYFVICQGSSPSQVEAITESIGDVVSTEAGEKPTKVVGLNNAQWVAMDYSDVLVHIFLPDTRQYYNLENLWEDAILTKIPNEE